MPEYNTSNNFPILYSFRRCPYAMRARLALAYALPAQSLELREVVLKDKPDELLVISPKATVPVLQLENQVVDESLDIMLWALEQKTDQVWLSKDEGIRQEILSLIKENDGEFKWALDHYKYSDRYEESQSHYRELGEVFLKKLDQRLTNGPYLMGESMSLLDAAIFPFVRQFAHVDKKWFDQCSYAALRSWLNLHLDSELFQSIMTKYSKWQAENDVVLFPLPQESS